MTTTVLPLVTVVITAYNREHYIAEAIESVLASTYTHFELIIVDDCSKDNTVPIIKSFADKDSRIKLYINHKNLGDYLNRNKAASYATGKYLKYCDSDDKLFDWTLDYCVKMMEKYPDVGMGILNKNKEMQHEYLSPVDTININFFDKEILAIGPSGTILRRDLFEKIGYFKPDYGPASDMYFNLKMASLFPIVLLREDFFYYRQHEGQEFNNKYSYLLYNYKYLKDAFDLPGFQLNDNQKKTVLLRAKKSFVMNFRIYIKESGNLIKAIKAIKLSNIGVSGFIKGVSQYSLKDLKNKLRKNVPDQKRIK
jgi:glycosyltransferase involved in cell wall biosynthesis